MRRGSNISYMLIFFLLLLCPLLLTNTTKEYVSEIDNRKLADFPNFSISSSYYRDIETYLQDRIGFRDLMIKAYDILNDRVANELTHPTYTYGQDGYIFFKQKDNIKYGDWHKLFAETVFKMQTYCESRGTKFYFMFEPEKNTVQKEKLPKGEQYDDSWVDEMLKYMDELGVNIVDNRSLLIEKEKEEAVFNRKFDSGHWNDRGCFYATNNLFKRMGEDFPSITELREDEFEIDLVVEKYLKNSQFTINETVPRYTLKKKWDDKTDEYIDKIQLDEQYRTFWLHTATDITGETSQYPRILVFQGSYYNGRPQYLIARASDYIAVHNYQNVLNLDYYYNMFQPDVVVFEVAQYTLNDLYFDSKKMKEIKWENH